MEATFLLTLLITFLASFIGYELISKIPQTLHTPLMSGSNAISGISGTCSIFAGPAKLRDLVKGAHTSKAPRDSADRKIDHAEEITNPVLTLGCRITVFTMLM